MDGKFQKVRFAALLSPLAIIAALVCFLLGYRRSKSDSESEIVVSKGVSRALLYDRNRTILAMDMPVSSLYLDTGAVTAGNSAAVREFLSDFGFGSADEIARSGDRGKVVLSRGLSSPERIRIEDAASARGLGGVIGFDDALERVYAYDAPYFARFVGFIDEDTRDGICGAEKEMNSVLKAKESLGDREEPGSDVTLSVDLSLCRKIESLLAGSSALSAVAVYDALTGDLLGFCDNAVDYGGFTGTQWFPDISSSKMFHALQIAAMVEKDPTLLEEYYCDGRGKCRQAHGLVNLNNIIDCPSAVEYLKGSNYRNSDLLPIIASFGVEARDLDGLLSLAYVAYFPKFIPRRGYVLGAGDSAAFDRTGSAVGAVNVSGQCSAYLANALCSQCADLRVFVVKDRFLVALYCEGGIDAEVASGLTDILGAYYV